MKVLQFPSAYPPGQSPYDVFKNRMSAILSIVGGIKGIIENKFINKQLSMIANNILNKVSEQKATDLSNLIMGPTPKEIYPDNLEDIVGQFVDKFAMGPMMQKETMMGKLPYPEPRMGPMMRKEIMTGGLPAVGGVTPAAMPTGGLPALGGITPTAMPTVTPTTETMIPKMDIYQIYNAVKDLPSGEISWDNIYKKMTEKKPFWMGTTESEQYVLNQMLGQVTDPKAKMVSDINLAKLVQETFYPEERRPGKYPYTEEEIKEFELWKASQKPDIKSILENIPKGFDISSFNVSTTGTTSFSFKPIDKTTPWEFDTWDEAVAFRDTHPQEGFVAKIETHGEGFDLTWYQKGAIDTLKPPTYYVAENIEKGFMEKVEGITDFTKELNRLRGLNIDTSTFETTGYFAELMKKKYDEALEYVNYALSKINVGIDEDEEGNHKKIYQEYYGKLESYSQEYFNVTGEHLLEEDSELRKERATNKALELAKEMVAEKKSLEDLDIDKVKAMGIDIEELKREYMRLYLEGR